MTGFGPRTSGPTVPQPLPRTYIFLILICSQSQINFEAHFNTFILESLFCCHFVPFCLFLSPPSHNSVTRFGEILPLWHKLKCLWQFNEGLFCIYQKSFPTSVNFDLNWAIFHLCIWTNNENWKSHLWPIL